ncbi:hypothetical protein CR513_33964, partial [Mucuna pruriens]
MDRSMIDVASGGALMDKTRAAENHLISNMASNIQQFGDRGLNPSPRCWTTSTRHGRKICGIYTSAKHPTDMCPNLQETELDQPENVGAIGGFQYRNQPYQSRPFDNQQHGR